MIAKVHVKKNDQVVVISGPATGDKAIKGKQGKILTVIPKENKVIVEGVAYVTKHQKPRRQGQAGGILPEGARHRRLQRHADLPKVRPGHPCGTPHCRGRAR